MAEKHLAKKGYKLIERNYFSKAGEIDLIMKDKKDYYVFIEVKKRTGIDFGRPVEYITPRKLRKIVRTAEQYITMNNLTDRNFRFDAIEIIEWENGELELNHIQNIWLG